MTRLFKIKEKFKLSQEVKMILSETAVFVLGFVLMSTKFIFGIYPFGLAYLCSLRKYTPFGFCGCLLSVIFKLNFNIVYLIALFGILGLRIVGSLIEKKGKRIIVLGEQIKSSVFDNLFDENIEVRVAISVFYAFGIGLYNVISTNYSYYEIFVLVLFSILVGILTYALSLTKPKDKLIPYGIITFALLYAMKDFTLFSLDVSIILGFGLTLYLSRYIGGIKAGAFGLVLGLCLSPALTPIFSIAGLVSGLLWSVSYYLAIMCASVLSIGYSVFVGGYTSLIQVTPSIIFVALLLYPLLRFKMIPVPDFIKNNATTQKSIDTVVLEKSSFKDKVALSTLVNVFGDISQTIAQISTESKSPTKVNLHILCTEVLENYCYNCPKHFICWQNDILTTKENLDRLSQDLLVNGNVNKLSVEEKFLHRCPNVDKIFSDVNTASKEKLENTVKNNKLDVLSQTHQQISDLISVMCQSNENQTQVDTRLSEKLKRDLAKIGLDCDDVRVVGKEIKEVTITGVNVERSKCSVDDLKLTIENLLQLNVDNPVFEADGSFATVTVKTLCTYSTKEVLKSVVKKGEEVCGDNVSAFDGANGKRYLLICDGMGSGENANVTSLTCVNFLKSILSVTNDTKIALSMLNNLIRAKGLESHSTVDLLEVDLITGKGSVTKCGASTTYVKRGQKVYKLQSKTMPIGILKDLDAEKLSFELSEKDVCIMVSDGIVDLNDNDNELVNFISNFKGNIDTLPEKIIEKTKKFNKNDDMSVCVVEIRTND
ncbi:MAG: SpoIIE family protein phosphatase [Clostridia bacterium]|nr:SpoIIE family protein phosphatase [Clostridia bacterium]